MIVAPSDHVITKENEYLNVVRQGLDYVSNHTHLLTLGILPSRPDTGYGYIQFDPNQQLEFGIRNVKTFTEKPSLELAKQFLESGEFVWNSGMFLWSAQSILKELEIHMPEEYSLFAEIATTLDTANEKAEIEKVYTQVRNISIDYGIMEKSSNVKVIPADIGWSDLGTWGSLFEELTKNNSSNSNAVVGNNVMLFDSSNCMIHVPKNKLVVIQGLKNFIVAEKDNTLLICKMEDEQKIKNLVNEVKVEKGDEYL
jgi:mannose-1-phosphate guanylyltransferase